LRELTPLPALLSIGNLWAFYHFFMVSRHHGELVKETGANAHPHR